MVDAAAVCLARPARIVWSYASNIRGCVPDLPRPAAALAKADATLGNPAGPMSATSQSFRLSKADLTEPPRIAVIGAGVAGAACAAGLLRAGFDVTVFDKSRGVGGRMATRQAQWTDSSGIASAAPFDHGCPHFTASRPRFRALVERAEKLGTVARWRQRVYATFPAPRVISFR